MEMRFRSGAAMLFADTSRARATGEVTLPAAKVTSRWKEAGPTNFGGRLTSLVCHPQQPERVWVGAAAGGVWASADGGNTWTSLWHNQDTLHVGSLAIDPADPLRLYAGTGEANLSADSYPGVGLFHSLDGGKTWALLADARDGVVPTRIGAVAIDPFDPKHLRLGGIESSDADALMSRGGMYKSTDGGKRWTPESFTTARPHRCHSIVFDPVNKGVIFATFAGVGAQSGVWRIKPGGDWMQLLNGLPDPERFGRASLAITPSVPQTLYLIAQDLNSGEDERVLGVFRSDSGGDAWENVAGRHFAAERQMSYGNVIAVHPRDPGFVICGGIDLHLSENDGKSWIQMTDDAMRRGDPWYAHADHHALAIRPPSPEALPAGNQVRIYDANDGGLDVSLDGGRSWQNRSAGLAVTMYEHIAVAATDAKRFGGGTQDNGTLITISGRSDDHFAILSGDGGRLTFDPADANHFYACFQKLGISRWLERRPADARPLPDGATEAAPVFLPYIAFDPHDGRIAFTGTLRVWRILEGDGTQWEAVSPFLDGGVVSVVEVAASDSAHVYVGTDRGGIFASVDGGNNWSENLGPTSLRGINVTRLATHPLKAEFLIATFAGVGNSHVLASPDGGRNWNDLDGGKLPRVPLRALAVRADQPDAVFVGGDAGVFLLPDLTGGWQRLTLDLPHVIVADLAYHLATRTLFAGTYGRGIWKLALT